MERYHSEAFNELQMLSPCCGCGNAEMQTATPQHVSPSIQRTSKLQKAGIYWPTAGISKLEMKRQEFEAAALPHLNDICRSATRLLADSTKADDVVQDVYLQAWKSFDRFEAGTNCRAWLYKILFHVVHHHRRKWFNVRMVKDSEEFLEQAVVIT